MPVPPGPVRVNEEDPVPGYLEAPMALFDAEHLIGQLLASELGGGSRRKRKKRLSRTIRGAAFSPQGLTLLGGIAFAAIEHLKTRGPQTPATGSIGSATTEGSPVSTASGSPTRSLGPGGRLPAPPGAETGVGSPGVRPANLPPIPGAGRTGDSGTPHAAGPGAAEASSTTPTSERDESSQRSRVLVRAMIEAAKADGEVDSSERARILEQLQAAGADGEARNFVSEQLDRALDLEGLIAWVSPGDPALAAQVYVASRVVIADESPAESAYLALLAARLGLSDELVRELRSQVDSALEPSEPA